MLTYLCRNFHYNERTWDRPTFIWESHLCKTASLNWIVPQDDVLLFYGNMKNYICRVLGFPHPGLWLELQVEWLIRDNLHVILHKHCRPVTTNMPPRNCFMHSTSSMFNLSNPLKYHLVATKTSNYVEVYSWISQMYHFCLMQWHASFAEEQ